MIMIDASWSLNISIGNHDDQCLMTIGDDDQWWWWLTKMMIHSTVKSLDSQNSLDSQIQLEFTKSPTYNMQTFNFIKKVLKSLTSWVTIGCRVNQLAQNPCI